MSLTLRAEAQLVADTHLILYVAPFPIQPSYVAVNAFGVFDSDEQNLQIRVFGRKLSGQAVIAHYMVGSEGVISGSYLPHEQ